MFLYFYHFQLYFFNVSVNTAPSLKPTTHKMEISTIKNIINAQASKLNQKSLPLKSGNPALNADNKNKQTLKSKDSAKQALKSKDSSKQTLKSKDSSKQTPDKTQQTLTDNLKKDSGTNQGVGSGGGKDKLSESNLKSDINKLVKRNIKDTGGGDGGTGDGGKENLSKSHLLSDTNKLVKRNIKDNTLHT